MPPSLTPGKFLSAIQACRKDTINKVIFPSLETVKLKQDPHLSFWGVPTEEFWKVVPQLLETAKEDPAVGGVMIHCYRSLVEKLNNDIPNKLGPDDTL